MKLNDLKQIITSSLIAGHTRNFIEKIGWNGPLLVSMLNDDVESFKKNSNALNADSLKECQLIATYLASKNVLSHLHRERGRPLNMETLNMAILSGEYVGSQLKQFTNKEVRPTYNSIRYAIKSGKVEVLRTLLDDYDLKPSNEHLIAAAATGNHEMVKELMDRGLEPEDNVAFEAADRSHNQEVINDLARFNRFTS